ncbi:hypothetical protein ACC699_39905, partial [Rhizobium ruizarguesonis]
RTKSHRFDIVEEKRLLRLFAGRIAEIGPSIAVSQDVARIDGKGAFISPGWVDLHVHIWQGGTDISIRPSECGVERGVTT